MNKPFKIAFTAAMIAAVSAWALVALPRASAQAAPADDKTAPAADKAASGFDSALIENWPEKPRAAAKLLVAKYGPPDESNPNSLAWHDNGPWLRTVVYRNEIKHGFPAEHTDFLEQTVAYKVPVDKIGELARFDGSLLVDRTKGELSSRCDKEENNNLALNLADDVARGKRTAADARAFLAKALDASQNGKTSPYLTALNFAPQTTAQSADPDEAFKK